MESRKTKNMKSINNNKEFEDAYNTLFRDTTPEQKMKILEVIAEFAKVSKEDLFMKKINWGKITDEFMPKDRKEDM